MSRLDLGLLTTLFHGLTMTANVGPCAGRGQQVTLLETLDRLLNQGVVTAGDITLSVADVDLIYVGLRLLLCSVETGREWGARGVSAPASASPSQGLSHTPPAPCASGSRTIHAPEGSRGESAGELDPAVAALPKRINADPEKVEQGLVKLVLTVVELLRRLLEKQGLRRVDAGSLEPEEVERMGVAFLRLEQKMQELLGYFGLDQEDLNLSFGSIGDLM